MPEIRFLQPHLLLFLPLILIPVVILLLLRRRYPLQPFGSLLLLRRIWEKRRRTIHLQDLLLLLLRMLILLLIVSLFARPVLRGGPGKSIAAHSMAHLLILDDTFSMRARCASATGFEEARARAARLLAFLPASAPCAVVRLSTGAGDWLGSPREALRALQAIAPSYLPAAFAQTAAQVRRQITVTGRPGVAVYVFSDFQANSLDSLEILRQTAVRGKHADWIFSEAPGCAPVQVWPDSLTLVPRSTGPNGRLEIRLGIAANAALPEPPSVESYIGSQRVSRRRLSSRPFPLLDTLVVPLRACGSLSGKILVDAPDGLADDNGLYFNFWNPPSLRVAVLTDRPELPAMFRAFRPSAAGGQTIEFVRMDSRTWKAADPGHDAVWLFELSQPGAALKDGLRAFLAQEKGVLIGLGPGTDPAAYNRLLLGPLGVGKLVAPQTGQGFRLISRLRTQNPLFSGFPARLREDVLFQQFFSLTPAPQTAVLAEMDDGSPFLVENRAWGGPLLVVAGSLSDETATNIAQSAFLVPFINRCVEAACSALRRGSHASVGQPI